MNLNKYFYRDKLRLSLNLKILFINFTAIKYEINQELDRLKYKLEKLTKKLTYMKIKITNVLVKFLNKRVIEKKLLEIEELTREIRDDDLRREVYVLFDTILCCNRFSFDLFELTRTPQMTAARVLDYMTDEEIAEFKETEEFQEIMKLDNKNSLLESDDNDFDELFFDFIKSESLLKNYSNDEIVSCFNIEKDRLYKMILNILWLDLSDDCDEREIEKISRNMLLRELNDRTTHLSNMIAKHEDVKDYILSELRKMHYIYEF